MTSIITPRTTRPGNKRKADAFLDDVETMARQGCTKAEAAVRRGQTWKTIERRIRRHGRADLVARFTTNSEARPGGHVTVGPEDAATAEAREHAYNRQLRESFETARRLRGVPPEGKRAA